MQGRSHLIDKEQARRGQRGDQKKRKGENDFSLYADARCHPPTPWDNALPRAGGTSAENMAQRGLCHVCRGSARLSILSSTASVDGLMLKAIVIDEPRP